MATTEQSAAFGIREADVGEAETTLVARPATATEVRSLTHPALTIVLHWGSAALIVVCAAVVLVREVIEHDGVRLALIGIHRQLGLLVLVGAVLRMARRLLRPLTDHAADMPLVTRLAAKAAHILLYAALAALPIVGWAQTNAHGLPASLFGLVKLPNLVAEDSDLADSLGDIHIYLAWGLLALVALHAGAALWHHFGRRDRVLRAMLPARKSARSKPTG